jgi:hypothetical protein
MDRRTAIIREIRGPAVPLLLRFEMDAPFHADASLKNDRAHVCEIRVRRVLSTAICAPLERCAAAQLSSAAKLEETAMELRPNVHAMEDFRSCV